MHQTILIIDFGSQYTQLIARRVRELNVYCEIHPYNHFPELTGHIKGVILSGSPSSVRDENAPKIDMNKIRSKVPVLGVCYGAQLLAQQNGGEVMASKFREYGRAHLKSIIKNALFKDIPVDSTVWMSHADTIASVPSTFEIVASTGDVKVAAYQVKNEPTYGIQFHPEVTHSIDGKKILQNFLVDICECDCDWTPASFIEETIRELKSKLKDDLVVLGLSGGVDSSVAAVLLHKAIGKNLHCIFVDNGLLRKDEFTSVLDSYKHMGLNVTGVDSKEKFYRALKGLSDPEQKRKAIGKTFIDVFQEEAIRIQQSPSANPAESGSKINRQQSEINWLAQGTIYPDVIESVSVKGPSATIKSHHNVGGLPEKMRLKVVEPLKALFKDEVRKVGKELNMEPDILSRHPFPGPGLAIRILGEITPEKIQKLQEADSIFIQALKDHHLYHEVWQAAAILLPVSTVGVMGDERTYENVVVLRAVTSVDGMTADWCRLPHEFLANVSSEIINRVKGVNRVVYDISSKPPATIEWE